jgi:transcription initiation factor TFIIE subunit beta
LSLDGIMSSYLDKQQAAFKSEAMSVAPKISAKRTLAPPAAENAPSPAPSNASNTSRNENKEAKRKREAQNVVYSQPAATGYGTEAFTQVTYVIEFLKKKDEPKTFREILEYLSQVNAEDRTKTLIAKILRQHERVRWVPDPELKSQTWDSGTFMHRPIINVRTKKDLIAYLQNKADAQGVSVKDLKDGWADCEEAIDELEDEHKILVTRTKKDNHARMVWSNDPSLFHQVDFEFQDMWRKTELPSVDELVRKLQEAGQKPASEDPSKRIKAAPKTKEKKRKAPRKGGKTTNTHMQHLLKDFSHLKR